MTAPAEGAPPLIRMTGIRFGYPGRPLVLDDLDFVLHPGDRIGLAGPNGSGKTTLFHLIMGLLRPLSGRIELFGADRTHDRDFRDIYQRIGLLFQDSDDQLFCPTVLEDVAFGPLNLGLKRTEAVETARETLDRLGMAGFENRVTHRLSGGEKRMVALAAVMAMDPDVLLLDEPSTGLDDATRDRLTEVLAALDVALVLISHEADFLERVARRVYLMENGRIRTDAYVHTHAHVHPHTGHGHA
jgi:cobalt/nickel transport system ATP-binding protein